MPLQEFIEEILSEGYAKISKDTPTDRRVWYLPHHGVYHPAKSNNIQVGFDCGTDHVGRSINEELMAGLISLIKLLVPRHREDLFSGSCKLQSLEPALLSVVARWGFEERASGSRDVSACAWWHIFAILQQLCPQKNFLDGKDQLGLKAAKTLQNNFYIDDLKSMAQEDQAVQLIKMLRLCVH